MRPRARRIAQQTKRPSLVLTTEGGLDRADAPAGGSSPVPDGTFSCPPGTIAQENRCVRPVWREKVSAV